MVSNNTSEDTVRSFHQYLEGWGRETWLFLECDQKHDQAKSKALDIYFQKFCCKLNTRNFNLDLNSSNSVGCAKNEMQCTSVWDSLPYPNEVFTSTPRDCKGGHSYADVITNFFGIDRFPFSLRHGALLCTCSTKKEYILISSQPEKLTTLTHFILI